MDCKLSGYLSGRVGSGLSITRFDSGYYESTQGGNSFSAVATTPHMEDPELPAEMARQYLCSESVDNQVQVADIDAEDGVHEELKDVEEEDEEYKEAEEGDHLADEYDDSSMECDIPPPSPKRSPRKRCSFEDRPQEDIFIHKLKNKVDLTKVYVTCALCPCEIRQDLAGLIQTLDRDGIVAFTKKLLKEVIPPRQPQGFQALVRSMATSPHCTVKERSFREKVIGNAPFHEYQDGEWVPVYTVDPLWEGCIKHELLRVLDPHRRTLPTPSMTSNQVASLKQVFNANLYDKLVDMYLNFDIRDVAKEMEIEEDRVLPPVETVGISIVVAPEFFPPEHQRRAGHTTHIPVNNDFLRTSTAIQVVESLQCINVQRRRRDWC